MQSLFYLGQLISISNIVSLVSCVKTIYLYTVNMQPHLSFTELTEYFSTMHAVYKPNWFSLVHQPIKNKKED